MTTPKIIAEGRYCVVDLESTGLSRKIDEAIQIAFGIIDNGVTRLRGYYTLRPGVPIKPGAERVHGISFASLEYSPRFADIAAELRALIGDRIVVGYSALTFDVPMLARQFQEVGIPFAPPIIDACRLSKRLYPGISHTLTDMTTHFGLPLLSHHSPWDDCKMTWQVLGALALRHPEIGDVAPSAIAEYAKPPEAPPVAAEVTE